MRLTKFKAQLSLYLNGIFPIKAMLEDKTLLKSFASPATHPIFIFRCQKISTPKTNLFRSKKLKYTNVERAIMFFNVGTSFSELYFNVKIFILYTVLFIH